MMPRRTSIGLRIWKEMVNRSRERMVLAGLTDGVQHSQADSSLRLVGVVVTLPGHDDRNRAVAGSHDADAAKVSNVQVACRRLDR